MSRSWHWAQKRQSKWFRCGKDIIKNIFEIENGSSWQGLDSFLFKVICWTGIERRNYHKQKALLTKGEPWQQNQEILSSISFLSSALLSTSLTPFLYFETRIEKYNLPANFASYLFNWCQPLKGKTESSPAQNFPAQWVPSGTISILFPVHFFQIYLNFLNSSLVFVRPTISATPIHAVGHILWRTELTNSISTDQKDSQFLEAHYFLISSHDYFVILLHY